MPVQFVKDEPKTLKAGTRFFAVDDTSVLYCQVKNDDCTEAFVLNGGSFVVRIINKRTAIQIPYLLHRSPIPIRHIGEADIPNWMDMAASIKWARAKFGMVARAVVAEEKEDKQSDRQAKAEAARIQKRAAREREGVAEQVRQDEIGAGLRNVRGK